MTARNVSPVRKQIVVEAPQERAFRVFTEKLASWWPPEYHIGKAAMKAAVLEPKADGRWYKVGEDGAQCDWGKVLVWEPPSRLVLAWQIDGQWQYNRSLVTEVEVKFIADGPRRTRVELEHRNLDRLGDAADEMARQYDSPTGWSGILERFARVAAG